MSKDRNNMNLKNLALIAIVVLWSQPSRAVDYNILDFGAKSDTTVLSTIALQQAIDLCSEAGGGRVVIPTGNFKIGSVILKSDVHLYIEHGATLYGSTDLKDYLPMKLILFLRVSSMNVILYVMVLMRDGQTISIQYI